MDITPAYGHIYCFTNTANGKQYIGQSTRVQRRIQEHLRAADIRSLLHRAIRKYGKHSFTVEVLCMGNDQEELDDREIYYIQTLGTFDPNGYNLSAGRGTGLMSDSAKAHLRAALAKPSTKELRKSLTTSFWQSDAYRQKHIDALRESWKDDAIRTRRIAGLKRFYNSPKGKETIKDIARARTPESYQRVGKAIQRFYQIPENRQRHSEKLRQARARPEVRQKMKEALIRRYQNPEARQRQRELLRAIWQRPEVREKHRIAVKNALASPEARKKISERVKAAMTPDVRQRISIALKGKKKQPEHIAKARAGTLRQWRFFSSDGTPHDISDLKTFCKEHGLWYQCMLDLVRGKQREHKGWRYTQELRPSQRGQKETRKTYHFISPEGERVTTTDLKRLCEERGLYYPTMCKVAVGKPWYNQHKGWRRDIK